MPIVATPGGQARPSLTPSGMRDHSSLSGVPLLNIRRDAISGASSQLRVSEWSVRRKVVAVLAIPGDRRPPCSVACASPRSSTPRPPTPRTSSAPPSSGPAVEYLAAAERLTLPASLSNRMGNGSGTPAQEFDSAATRLRARRRRRPPERRRRPVRQRHHAGRQRDPDRVGYGHHATAPVQLTDIQRVDHRPDQLDAEHQRYAGPARPGARPVADRPGCPWPSSSC